MSKQDFIYLYEIYTESGNIYRYYTNEKRIQLENNLSEYKFLWVNTNLIPVRTITLVSLIEETP